MSEKYNAERYCDPTAAAAIANIENRKRKQLLLWPLVYICSPYRGDINQNVKKAQVYSRFAVEQQYVPLAPHLLFPQFVSEVTERRMALKMDSAVLLRCDEVWVFGDEITGGMASDIRLAKAAGKPVHYFASDLREVIGK